MVVIYFFVYLCASGQEGGLSALPCPVASGEGDIQRQKGSFDPPGQSPEKNSCEERVREISQGGTRR